jgi:hypothetical protein
MHTFLDEYNLPKLTQEDINHLNMSIMNNKIEAVIESPKKNSASVDGFAAEFYQAFM